MAAEEPWDVIVVGAGNAALCAALSAAEQGVKVLVLEKATLEDRGGKLIKGLQDVFPEQKPIGVKVSASDWVANTTATFFLRSVFSHSRMRSANSGSSRNSCVRLMMYIIHRHFVRWSLARFQ